MVLYFFTLCVNLINFLRFYCLFFQNRTLVLLLVLFGIVFSQDQEPAVETQELEEGSAPVAAWSDAYLLVRRSITAKDDVFVTDVDLTVELYAINVGTRFCAFIFFVVVSHMFG